FGDQPQIRIGGQSVVIDKVISSGDDGYNEVHLTTMPHYAGPAAVQLMNSHGLEDIVIGGFTYLDLLQISYITPPVVRVDQSGEYDIVEIIGYRVHNGLVLKADPSGRPDLGKTDTVDNDRLRLYSAQKMTWVVADLGDNYRGFVDIELSDGLGRGFILPKALFMGKLGVSRGLESRPPFDIGELKEDIKRQEAGLPSLIVPDPLKLPPGRVVDLASDTGLGLVYVLGAPVRVTDGPKPDSVTLIEDVNRFFTPGWISLIHYERDSLDQAAPMLGLGYYDLPQDLNPTAMALGSSHLYVAAKGYDFPFINTPYEAQTWLLVYDREDRLPGSLPADGEGKDRDILYSVPLPLT